MCEIVSTYLFAHYDVLYSIVNVFYVCVLCNVCCCSVWSLDRRLWWWPNLLNIAARVKTFCIWVISCSTQ